MAIAESSTNPSPGPFKAGIVAGRAYGSLSSDGKNEFAAKSVTRGSAFITGFHINSTNTPDPPAVTSSIIRFRMSSVQLAQKGVVLQNANGRDLVRCVVTRKRPALFRGRHFEDVIILLCVRWYLRYSLARLW